jgi:hypothetical protein
MSNERRHMSNKIVKTGVAGGLITASYIFLGTLGIIAILAIPVLLICKIIKWIVE